MRSRRRLAVGLALIAGVWLLSFRAWAQVPAEMEKHTLLLLVLTDNPPELSPDDAQALQVKHLAHIRSMGQSGKLLAAGPFSDRDDERLRGMLIFDCPLDEAREMASKDPAVQAGRLKVVAMNWWTAKDAVKFAAAQPKP